MSLPHSLSVACRFLLCTTLITAATLLLHTNSVQGDERDQYRAEFQHCPDHDAYPALDGIYPEHLQDDHDAHFYYIADVEVCPNARTVSIRHTIKNLDRTARLPFNWEGTLASHIGLPPGKECCNALMLIQYQGTSSSSRIMYGTRLNYSVPAAIYPVLDETSEDTTRDVAIGDALISKVETDYIDITGRTVHVLFEARSEYDKNGLIGYSFSRTPADIFIALGNLAGTALGDKVIHSFFADVAVLEKFIQDPEAMARIPKMFSTGEFLLISPKADLSSEIVMQAIPTTAGIVPVAVLNDKFQPVVTSAVTVLTP